MFSHVLLILIKHSTALTIGSYSLNCFIYYLKTSSAHTYNNQSCIQPFENIFIQIAYPVLVFCLFIQSLGQLLSFSNFITLLSDILFTAAPLW